jgi:lactoylglutathione lyase
MIKKVDHITINAKDIEQSLFFYKDILGFQPKPTKDFKDHRYYFFEIPGGVTLDIGEYDFDESYSEDSITAKGRMRHLAFEVEDILEFEKRINESGYSFFAPIEYRETLGFSSGLVHGPNGIELEFLQYGNPFTK